MRKNIGKEGKMWMEDCCWATGTRVRNKKGDNTKAAQQNSIMHFSKHMLILWRKQMVLLYILFLHYLLFNYTPVRTISLTGLLRMLKMPEIWPITNLYHECLKLALIWINSQSFNDKALCRSRPLSPDSYVPVLDC